MVRDLASNMNHDRLSIAVGESVDAECAYAVSYVVSMSRGAAALR
jgi:hypothetical protein